MMRYGFAAAVMIAAVWLQGPVRAAPAPQRPYDVCNYVLDHYHNGRLDDGVSAPQGELTTADGSKMNFAVSYEGTAREPVMTSDNGDVEAQNFYPPRSTPTDITVIPYEGHFYLLYSLDEGLNSVVEPNGGLICVYNKTLSPVMLTDRASGVCRKFSENALVELRPAPVRQDAIVMDRQLLLPGENHSTGVYHLAREGEDLVAFTAFSGAGSGCEMSGVAFVKDGKVEDSARNEALYAALGDVNDCRTGRMRPVRADGALYFLTSGVMPEKPGIEVSQLLELQKDELKEICRIEKLPSYTPFP